MKCQNRDSQNHVPWDGTHTYAQSHTRTFLQSLRAGILTPHLNCVLKIQSFQPNTKITPARTMMGIDTCIEREQKHTRCLLQNTIHFHWCHSLCILQFSHFYNLQNKTKYLHFNCIKKSYVLEVF